MMINMAFDYTEEDAQTLILVSIKFRWRLFFGINGQRKDEFIQFDRELHGPP